MNEQWTNGNIHIHPGWDDTQGVEVDWSGDIVFLDPLDPLKW